MSAAVAPSSTRARLSLRDRVLVGFAAIAAIAIAIAVAVTATTHQYQMAQLDERLESFAGPFVVDQPMQRLPRSPSDDLSRPSDALRGFLAADGELHVVLAPTVDDAGDAVPVVDVDQLSPTFAAVVTAPSSDGSGDFRVLARPAGNGWDVTALSMDSVQSASQRLIAIETAGIALMLGGLGLVAWWMIRMGITPMRRMIDASSRIAAGDLDVRLEGAGRGSETAELAGSLNAMIATLTDSLRERERSETRLREFVADASHELRTPLTTVLGYSELHRRGALPRKADQTDAWARTEAEAGRMRRLVDDMLELAKYDAEPQLAQAPIALAQLARDVVADASAAFPDSTFSAAGDELTVTGDADRLRQALLNVISNAALHGGATVAVAVERDGGRARVSVMDDGPGMAPEIAARATERFVRGDSSRQRATGGAGLGLAITAAIVQAHGGDLDVESTEGEGTRVTIALPLAAGPPATPRPDVPQ
ncbi:sensor histidine kinase [Demequina muriae]|uniref:histidine kinase n=1 Tax=Demequina muriae TaxID=3051664 RepID=A0ABT8GGU5_9MICO|nr:HAMP domain-containing sensor histidine kinase [Demequina sp. EGI L300058]MDN4480653.1 HAMP domain-containing sensor histidine kinase [Demequina sp. EGI L300058]